jgi:hypothetical protein
MNIPPSLSILSFLLPPFLLSSFLFFLLSSSVYQDLSLQMEMCGKCWEMCVGIRLRSGGAGNVVGSPTALEFVKMFSNVLVLVKFSFGAFIRFLLILHASQHLSLVV